MNDLVLGKIIFYFTGQGGRLGMELANTLYPIPSIAICQHQERFDYGPGHPWTGKTWLITLTWLFWTVGVVF